MLIAAAKKKWKNLGPGILFILKNIRFENLMWLLLVQRTLFKEVSLFFFLHGAVSCPPLPCYTVTIVLNVKFYFSSYLQRDFSACKPEQLIPPPLLLSWPWTRNSLCQSCFLVYFGHELQTLWAGSGSGRFCSIWLWHCWWIPSNKRIVLENNVKSTLNW